MINSGAVAVDGVTITRPAELVDDLAEITATPDHYVSRAAHKLLGALDDLPLTVTGRALDAGSSTGGFTQVLLERGCAAVIAIDVGTDQLDPRLRRDPRVRVYEQTNLRDLDLDHVARRPVDLLVADVSFISLVLLIEPFSAVIGDGGQMVLMIKPQFEVGRERLGRGRGGSRPGAPPGRHRSGGRRRPPIRLAARGDRAQPAARSGRQPGVFRPVRPPVGRAGCGALNMLSQVTRTVAVLTHMGRPAAIAAATRLIEGLSAAGIIAALPEEDLSALEPRFGPAVTPLPKPIDAAHGIELMVVLGGDGTILRGTEWVLVSEIPLLGVNLGHIGFLAEAESSEIDSIVERIVQRSYTVEERFTIEVTLRDCDGGAAIWSSYAINEVSIEKASRERMLEVLVEVDGRPLSRWACDGMLVATPTGSTAYAFSAGGPVIWPGVDALLVVPLSAHALFARPLVLGPTSTVVVEVVDASQTHGVVWCDGRRSIELRAGMEIEVIRGEHRLRLARLSEAPFTDRLVNKFGLRVEGWRGTPEARGRTQL